MSKSHKRQAELKRAQKRRARRPIPSFVPPAKLKVSGGQERRVIREHEDVLQNIEFALVAADRNWDDIDDRIVAQVLRAAILRTEPEDPLAHRALAQLNDIRATRPEISDEEWTDALRVVFTSLRRHSDCRSGDRGYLDFVSNYII